MSEWRDEADALVDELDGQDDLQEKVIRLIGLAEMEMEELKEEAASYLHDLEIYDCGDPHLLTSSTSTWLQRQVQQYDPNLRMRRVEDDGFAIVGDEFTLERLMKEALG